MSEKIHTPISQKISSLFLLAILLCGTQSFSQTGQLNIPRIDQMPDFPSPYVMRDWKQVATQYDAFVFDQNKSGQYLPLVKLKPSGVNYPAIQPILMATYVGTNSATQAEAINIIPAVVGASLLNIDKSNQGGLNWVEKIKDFYNSANGQHVYLNGPNASSGNDWWYDLMPNVFFYQLYNQYPSTPGFEDQFISVADQWLKAVHAMGGNTIPWTAPQMNYRGWYLSSMTGNATGVKEPESAGTIGWLLYQAYVKTGEKKYLDGAQLALEYLSGLNSNPSYELQLPYGTLTAAKLNATIGTNFDIGKMLNWSFNRGDLRGWGTIVGKWDGKDVSGLIGEANDQGNDYAFLMNGFQQAAALVPLVKYDKRYAKAIAKWTLNLANASRLLYPGFLDSNKQDDFAWSHEFDPQSVIGYEALKENWQQKALYGTGDAKRNNWANTNLGIYGSSHVGYLAAIVETTDVAGILKLDLNKTDFFADRAFSTFLFYNPLASGHQVTVQLGAGAFDLYDAISETLVAENVTGNFQLQINAGAVMLITYLPAGTTRNVSKGKLYAGTHVIDYHYGYDFNPVFRLKSFSSKDSILAFNQSTLLYATIENAPSSVSYNWFINDLPLTITTEGQLLWTSPGTEGEREIKVEIVSNGQKLKDSLLISVVEHIPTVPVITTLEPDQKFYLAGSDARIIAWVENASKEHFTYTWNVPSGNMVQQDSLLQWTTPPVDGLYLISCKVKNDFNLSTVMSMRILIKHEGVEITSPLAYYPLNIDFKDYSGNAYDAHGSGTQEADDALGLKNLANRFSSSEDIIYVDNQPSLNFSDAITLSFWITAGTTGREAFILSHGSWEERWKVSITPDRKLRWTVKTDEGVKDLDSSFPLTVDQYYHCAVVYSGYSMEMYIDGALDHYIDQQGLMPTTEKAITFGQKSVGERQYFLNGVLDEVRIYHAVLQPDEIGTLKTLWHDEPVTATNDPAPESITVFPNPVKNGTCWINYPFDKIKDVQLMDPTGKFYSVSFFSEALRTKVVSDFYHRGPGILKITTRDQIKYLRVIFIE